MAESKVTDNRSRRYIRITDDDSWNMIDEIARADYYKNSFNKIINDALFYGLPVLYDKVVGGVTDEERKEIIGDGEVSAGNIRFYALLVRLMREVILNVNINKSVLSSLYNAKAKELEGGQLTAQKFKSGYLCDTPEYLTRYETEGIKSLRK